MDPAFVVDEQGKRQRAGWDVQTAYPNSDPGEKPLNQPGEAKELPRLSSVVIKLESQLEKVKQQRDAVVAKYEQAKKARGPGNRHQK